MIADIYRCVNFAALALRRITLAVGTFASPKKPANITDLEYQVRRFHSFLWAGGGGFSDFNIHLIDHLCWMKNAWPISAQGVGGRNYRFSESGEPFVDFTIPSMPGNPRSPADTPRPAR